MQPLWPVSSNAVLGATHLKQAIVFIMRTNPHPGEVIAVFDGKGSVSQPNANRPELANFFEVQRGMLRIRFE